MSEAELVRAQVDDELDPFLEAREQPKEARRLWRERGAQFPFGFEAGLLVGRGVPGRDGAIDGCRVGPEVAREQHEEADATAVGE